MFTIKPIGVVRTLYSDDDIRNSIEGVPGYIEIFPEYEEGLEGLEEFSHIIVIAYLHKVSERQRDVLKVKPRRLVRLGIDISDVPEIGVFASDSPHRPNPIALSILELLERRKNILYVNKLDLFNGTPVIDIKPYTRDRIIDKIKVPDWINILERKILQKFGDKKIPI
ncbi:MAG: tRNA (N6-threonylcarbamoyladenosine(37)-N6)-methyltransferase TrmO [Desulfurococcales archaeon]|jgi:tRNA-Thr(GGU) m(6)t(6)A37 methyltransferase TsaA|nr:tRNA (N6-threonylcarbamoyladenosine(37)-N6)-methyltransferase TrmO [Desulfurococcales archaeon]